MQFKPTDLPGVVLIEPKRFDDERGWFMESYSEARFHDALAAIGLPRPRPFVQDNHTLSAAGVLRGLHFQLPPHPQGKLVRVIRGAAFDIALDVRRSSPAFGRWSAIELSAANQRQLWIPEGFAHGFLALDDNTELLYKTTDVYAQPTERAIRWNDPALGIPWPLPPSQTPVLAAKDATAPLLADVEVFA